MAKVIIFIFIILCSCSGKDYSDYQKPSELQETSDIKEEKNEQTDEITTVQEQKEWIPPQLKTIYKDPILIPGDVVLIEVINEATLTKTILIPGSGKINYALIKEFQIAGKTIEKATEDLKEKLSNFIEDPLINLTVSLWKERKIYVDGLETGSRAFALPNNEVFTISRFLLTIGVSPYTTNIEGVEIVRENILGDIDEGREKKLYLPLEVIFENYDTENDIPLQPEDLVVLQKKEKVYIHGGVVLPGNYPIDKNKRLSLWELILLANGPLLGADLNNIEVVRETEENKRVTIKTSVGSDAKEPFYLQPNDIVTISAKKETNNIVTIYGEVRRPGALAIPDPETRLSIVLGLAGGLSEFASSNVRIIRHLPEKTVKFVINFDKILAGDRKEDIFIKGGDLIIADSGW